MTQYRYLDGPKLVEWIEARVDLYGLHRTHSGIQRRLYEWRKGGRARDDAVESILIRLGLHPYALPESLYGAEHSAQPDNSKRDDALDLYHAGLEDDEIARTLGVGMRKVQNWRVGAGLKTHRAQEYEAKRHRALELFRQGWSDSAVAEAVDASRKTVWTWRNDAKIPRPVA